MDGNDDPRQRGTAWMAKGGGIGGVGGGALEQPRQWTARPVGQPLYPWECRAALSRQARPEEAQEPSWGDAKATTLTMLRRLPATACQAPARWACLRGA